MHPTPLAHWQAVGALRAQLAKKGLSLSSPEAHVAECAIEAGALLWSRDTVFRKVTAVSALRLFEE